MDRLRTSWHRSTCPRTSWWPTVFLLVVQALFIAALAALFVRDRRVSPVAAFAILFVIARHQGLAIEGFFLLVVGLLALLAVLADRRLPLAAAATLAAILLLVKMSLGVASLVILAGGTHHRSRTLSPTISTRPRPASFPDHPDHPRGAVVRPAGHLLSVVPSLGTGGFGL